MFKTWTQKRREAIHALDNGELLVEPDSDVIIIGAGAAGLAAAKALTRLDVSYTLVEASHRIGGRAYCEELAPGVWFDLGCAWMVGEESNPFAAIADARGIALDRKNGGMFRLDNHRFHRNGTALDADERAACVRYYRDTYRAISTAAAQGRDVALTDVIDTDHAFAAPYLCAVASGWGLDADLISTADNASTVGELDYQALDGYGNLVALWGADVPVLLNTRVAQINWTGRGITVETNKGSLTGRTALVTVSTGMLGAGAIRFMPELPDWKTVAINNLPMGTKNKMGLYFDSDVFGAQGRGHYTLWNDAGNNAPPRRRGGAQRGCGVRWRAPRRVARKARSASLS